MRKLSDTTMAARKPRKSAHAPETETTGAGFQMTAGATASSEEEIRQKAYEIFLSRGDGGGDDVSDWLEAERQVRGASGSELI